MAQSVSQEIRQFLVDSFLFGENDESLGNEDSLMEKGIVDSTGVLQIVTFLDEQYGINVADAELVADNFDSISRLCAFVERKKAS